MPGKVLGFFEERQGLFHKIHSDEDEFIDVLNSSNPATEYAFRGDDTHRIGQSISPNISLFPAEQNRCPIWRWTIGTGTCINDIDEIIAEWASEQLAQLNTPPVPGHLLGILSVYYG